MAKLLKCTLLLAFVVITIGAYTRLTDAGLGCPDWPGCYGRFLAPNNLPSAEQEKAWTEMIHRYLAGSLGLLVFVVSFTGLKQTLRTPKTWLFPILLTTLVIFQALLGMWTVTLKLYPVVVMAHLLGGFSLIGLLYCYQLNRFWNGNTSAPSKNPYPRFSTLAFIALCLQILLGGWTSANYAALVCLDFPTCNGQLLPTLQLKQAFDFFNVNLDHATLVSIQVLHRLGAVVVLFLIGLLSFLTKNKLLAGLLGLQILLGILNVLAKLPLMSAVLHNATAICLMLAMIHTLYASWYPNKPYKTI